MEVAAFMALLVIAGLWVAAPLRRPAANTPDDLDVPALEAERDARLAAVRDAELDRLTGKLSAEDHRTLDAELRAEALDAIRALDREPPTRREA
jgi:hypothetical protein